MRALAVAVGVAVSAAAGLGCGASTMRVASLDELERVRAANAGANVAAQAPQVLARAEQERAAARADHARGDDVGASLHAERAVAAYAHARAVARLATAIAALADSQKSLDDATALEQSLATARAKLEADGQELERRAEAARERLVPARSRESTADRDASRSAAARALAIEGRLLCGAARLLAADAGGLADALGELDKLDARLRQRTGAKEAGAPVDDAGADRARCLDVLTRARRTAGRGDGRADALLAELSAAGGWDPTRDERGIVVTVRGSFAGAKLTDEGRTKFETLGRVAAAHPDVGLQVVVHDAQEPAEKEDTDTRRADAVAKALVAGGASSARLSAEMAGARVPLVEPNDERLRARNERVDVVFVSGI